MLLGHKGSVIPSGGTALVGREKVNTSMLVCQGLFVQGRGKIPENHRFI